MEYDADPENARFYLLLVRRREIELISDGNKLIENKVICTFHIVYLLIFKYVILFPFAFDQ